MTNEYEPVLSLEQGIRRKQEIVDKLYKLNLTLSDRNGWGPGGKKVGYETYYKMRQGIIYQKQELEREISFLKREMAKWHKRERLAECVDFDPNDQESLLRYALKLVIGFVRVHGHTEEAERWMYAVRARFQQE